MHHDQRASATVEGRGRWLSVGIAAWALSCSPAPAPDLAGSPNVLLITVDTLRADLLGCYGGAAETPNLDLLASQGMVFDNAVAPVPSTRPSHFTLLTGKHPRLHGVLSNADSLPEGMVTLPMALRDAGYDTSGFTGVKLLAPGSGAERGFDRFEAPASRHRVAAEVVDSALEWLLPRLADPTQPWFLWLHVYDPHMPYGPPESSASPPSQLPAGTDEFSRPLLRSLLEGGDGDLPDWLFDYALSRYRDEVEYVDAQLGRLLTAIEEHGVPDRTLTLFTADHGECFGNGHYFEHGRCLYEGSVRVPLILRYPSEVERGARSDRLVELGAVAATILRLIGEPNLDGAGSETLFDPAAVAVIQRPVYGAAAADRRAQRLPEMRSVRGEPVVEGSGPLVAVRTEDWKLLWDGERASLYDLGAEGSESIDLAAARPDVVRELRELLTDWEREHPMPEPSAELDPEHEDMLRSLGYL